MGRRGGLLLFMALLGAIFFYRKFIYIPEVDDFSQAKAAMEEYVIYDNRVTLYCGAEFDADKHVAPDQGFYTEKHKARAGRVEWEHAVPVENFGRSFKAWREGSKYCEKDGKPYRGRKCAAKTSREFRKMEADMYNLFPVIGAVNASRSNRDYAELPRAPAAFGSCAAKIEGRRFEPPDRAKGQVARASLYMDSQYRRFRLSTQQKQLFTAWDRMFPVDRAECRRAKRIERIQKNANPFVKEPCIRGGFW